MADELKTILIKDLQEAESAADTDYIAIDNGTVTKKIRVDNYNKTANGTAKSYAESAKESADKAQRNADSISSTISEITNNITAAQSAAIQSEKSAEAAESATLNLQTYVNAAKESADNAKASEESTKNVADKIADSNKIAQSYAVGGTNYRTGEDTDNARYYYSGAKTAEANSETYKSNAAASESAAATSEINAKASETNAAKSAASASSSAESATTSKTAAATSAQNASNSANYARANATRAESYAIGGTSSRSGEDTDNAKYYAQQAKKSAETAAGSITGVSSFNGRTGTIMPENGDYKAEQISYDNSASGVSANTVQSAIDKVAESDAKKAIKADVDSALNLKANKADVSSSLSGKQDNLGIKSIGSNLTLSNGVLDAKKQLTVDTALSTTSANPVQNKAVAAVTDQLAKNTAQIETAGTATNAHSAGEYVMISNALYKVTASVAKGDTWTIGTNVTAANIGSEIGSLKSDLAEHSTIITLVGSIFNEKTGPGIATGVATVVLNGGMALIFFDAQITTLPSISDKVKLFTFGINIDHLRSMNSSIPFITPLTGGVINYTNSDGTVQEYLRGFGGCFQARNDNSEADFLPARIYTTNGYIGGWGGESLQDTIRMSGVAIGTY